MLTNIQCNCREIIGSVADIAAIVTAAVAVWAYVQHRSGAKEKQSRLEDYLKAEAEKDGDKGMRTMLHLVRHLGLTETEIMNASFKNKHIGRRTRKNPETGAADTLFFVYVEKPELD